MDDAPGEPAPSADGRGPAGAESAGRPPPAIPDRLWAAEAALATFSVALLDLLLVVGAAPAAASRALGALQTWALTVATLAPAAVALAAALPLLDRPSVRAWLPSSARLLAAAPLAIVATAAWARLERAREAASVEFPAEPRRIALVVGALALVAVLAAQPAAERLVTRALARVWPAEGGRARHLACGVAAVLLLDLAHHGFGPLHELGLAAGATLGALGCAIVAFRGIARQRTPREAAFAGAATLLVSVWGIA